jgi:hypothetical protein
MKFLYEFILTKFGYPLKIITDHGVHFNNDKNKYMTNHFMLIHVNKIVAHVLTTTSLLPSFHECG